MADRFLFEWSGRYGLKLGQHGEDWLLASAFDGIFLIDRQVTTIRAYCAEMPPRQEFMDVLVRRIFPRIATLLGATAIHAAALGDRNGGLLLLGASGAGKSTLTAALAHFSHWDILSEDISIVWNDGEPVLAPAATGVCVWPESQAALKLDPAFCSELPGYDGKLRYDRTGDHSLESPPLRGAVFLNRSVDCVAPRLDPMTRAESLIGAINQLIAFNPAAPIRTGKALLVGRLNAILGAAPSYRLTYPGSYAALPAVTDLLREVVTA